MFKRGNAEERSRRAEERLARQQERIRRLDAKLGQARAKTEEMRQAAGHQDATLAGLRGRDVFVAVDGRELVFRPARGTPRSHTIDPGVTAQVETAGNLVRRPTLVRAAAGAAIAGPLGALLGGAAWKKEDARELYLVVEAEEWVELVQLDPSRGADARAFAQAINLVARQA